MHDVDSETGTKPCVKALLESLDSFIKIYIIRSW